MVRFHTGEPLKVLADFLGVLRKPTEKCSGVNREQCREKAVTGRQGIREYSQKHNHDECLKRRFDSAPGIKFIV